MQRWGCGLLALLLPLAAGASGLSLGERGLRFSTADENLRLRVGGRIHADSYIFEDHRTRLDNDIDFRRLRLYLSGRVLKDWRFKIDREFQVDRRGWRNLWLSYRGFDHTDIKLGNLIAPVGFESLMSSNDLMLMERSLVNALSTGYLAGLQVSRYQRHWSATVGAYLNPIGGENEEQRRSDGVSFVGRFTLAPVRKKHRLLHFGVSVEQRHLFGASGFRFRNRPESGGASRIVDTRNLSDVDNFQIYGVELASAYGPLSFIAEYRFSKVDRSAHKDARFGGGYLQASVMLTGESRRYSSRRATFTRIRPKHKWGALELSARLSMLDLTDSGVRGGDESDTTLGVNWYLNRNLRLMFNFVRVNAHQRKTLAGDRPDLIQFRLQVAL
ncbi:MAG: OprO/OprP family phosphate-selective porin [Myxococcota bacterium]